MLIVLMAIINLGRMKVHAATRWLWLALSGGMFVAAPVGCERECNCRCECGQPAAAEQAIPVGAPGFPDKDKGDKPDAGITDQTGDALSTDTTAPQSDVKEPGNADGKATDKPADTVKKTTRKTPKEPAKPPVLKPVVPDVPQVAYGPPPVIDPGREIQPLYGVPIDRDRMPQIMYGPPSNMDLKNPD